MIFLPASCFAILVFAIGGGYISKAFTVKIVKFFACLTPFIFLIHKRIIDAARTLLRTFGLAEEKYLVALIAFVVTLLLVYFYDALVKKKRAVKSR